MTRRTFGRTERATRTVCLRLAERPERRCCVTRRFQPAPAPRRGWLIVNDRDRTPVGIHSRLWTAQMARTNLRLPEADTRPRVVRNLN